MAQTVEVLTPVGRIVGGHPMRQNPQVDDRTQQPQLGADGKQRTEAYIGLAIPKQGEQNWQQTAWGALLLQAAVAGWVNGEHMAPAFSWKVTDGDSPVPNKKGKKPCDKEGYPGHWVLNCATGLPIRCYHTGKFAPHEQIQNENEIKAGDYCRVLINAKANVPSQTPGIYLNPAMLEVVRAGVAISTDSGPSAADAFGAKPAQMPQGAMVDTAVNPAATGQNFSTPINPAAMQQHYSQPSGAANPPAAVPPFLQQGGGPLTMTAAANGATYEQFKTFGYDDARMIAEGYALPRT